MGCFPRRIKTSSTNSSTYSEKNGDRSVVGLNFDDALCTNIIPVRAYRKSGEFSQPLQSLMTSFWVRHHVPALSISRCLLTTSIFIETQHRKTLHIFPLNQTKSFLRDFHIHHYQKQAYFYTKPLVLWRSDKNQKHTLNHAYHQGCRGGNSWEHLFHGLL